MNRIAFGSALAVVAVVLAGCSNDETEPTPGSTPPASVTPSDPGSGPASEPASEADVDPTVVEDATRLAPALEAYSRSTGYAKTLDEALAKLAAAGLAPTEPNVVGDYGYDKAEVEFRLCVQSPEGSWAIYDTSPMSILETRASGGCPSSSPADTES